jgi:hypothetical protein
MHKIFFFVFSLFFFFSANAQNDIVIKGTVYDINTQIPLELATVYFSTAKDSTLLEYATTDKNGVFKISTKKYDKSVFLKVNYMGYQPYIEAQDGLLESKDFGKLYLLQNTNLLNEVVIKSEAPPIRVKKDTLEFNAASFKVRPDANVEILLKQLPGFEIDSNGKITVNGKDVTQFLVNGKAFFDKDGVIALKNLPADLISKVQVSDFKTKKEELAKQESSSDFATINLTIDEKKNKGYFGKFLGGYGTDDRYENSLIVNFFDNKQKISVLASANNINSSGFTQDEVFDSMGGGRNSKENNRTASIISGKGITTSNLVGFNYSDQWSKEAEASSSYNFSNTINENESKSNQASFLPKGTIFSNSSSKTRNENTGNKANFEFEYKLNPTIRIVVIPKMDQTRSNSLAESASDAEDGNRAALNSSTSESRKESTANNFTNAINFNKTFEKKARNLSFEFNNNNTNNDSEAKNISETIFLQGTRPDDKRNQTSQTANIYDSYSADIEYTEPITDSLRIRIGSDFGWSNTINDLKTFNYDETSQLYAIVNDAQTNYTTSTQNTFSPKVGLTFEKNNFTVNLNSNTAIVDFNNYSLYLNKETNLNKNYILPFGRAQVRYKLDRSKFLTVRYEYSTSLPLANQLLPVANLANPLNTIRGNENLNPNKKSGVNLNFRDFNFRSRTGYSVYMRADFFGSEIIMRSDFDESGKRQTTYENVSGTYSTYVGGNWNKTIKKEAHVLRFGLNLNANYSLDKGFTNTVSYNAKSLGISPSLYLSYDYGELLTVAPSYNYSYHETNFTNTSLNSSSNFVHRINLQTTNYWPKNWVFGNDFGYTYNSNISDGFKKDFYLWNTSLSYRFLDKRMTLKAKVFDVLNQNLSISRTISPTTIRDEENTVLKRYAMFSLAYKMGAFGKKERRSRESRMKEMDNMD